MQYETIYIANIYIYIYIYILRRLFVISEIDMIILLYLQWKNVNLRQFDQLTSHRVDVFLLWVCNT